MTTKNKLLEAAADILASSKKSASAMPPAKLPGTEVDLGGPTPQNGKPDDNSNKIDATKGAKSATAPSTKPSDASSDTQNHPQGGKKTMKEDEELEGELNLDEEEDILVDEKLEWKDKMKEDVNSMFSDDDALSEEFRTKAATIFEARIMDRVAQIEEQVEVKYASMFEEAVEEIKSDLTNKVNDYLEYVVEQWMADNEIAIESGLRSEITEDFISGLRNLFAEHYIDVPSDKVDVLESLAAKVEELESRLNEEMNEKIELKNVINGYSVKDAFAEVTEGLTLTQVEKFRVIAESLEFNGDLDSYKNKLETIKENYFSGKPVASSNILTEEFESDNSSAAPAVTGEMSKYVSAISRTLKK